MYFDFQHLDGKNTYKIMASVIVPRPIAWIVTQSTHGGLNAAPFSFFNALSGDPPIVGVGIGRRDGVMKDTGLNIERTGEFVVNLVSLPQAEAMNVTATEYDYEVDEIDAAGLQTLPSQSIATPRIAGSPVALECRHYKTVELDENRTLYLGSVVGAHVDDAAVLNPERCYIDAEKLELIGRMHGADWYVRTSDLFKMPRLKP